LIWLVLFTYAALTALAWLFAERVIFQPPPASYSATRLPVDRVAVDGTDSVAVLHLPNPDARYTILYSHGNAEDLGHLVPILEQLRQAGFAVLAYDYRGYGASTRVRPTARRTVEDLTAVYDHAVHALGIGADRLVLYGRSVGSGPALELAAERPIAGVILESAFTSTYRVVTRVPLLLFDRFPNLARIRNVQQPVLVIHGTRDEVIPFSHGRQLYAAAPGPKQSFWVEGALHNDIMNVAGERYPQALAGFVRLLDGDAEPRP
jgi:abhydrolase domain-containing protein 17